MKKVKLLFLTTDFKATVECLVIISRDRVVMQYTLAYILLMLSLDRDDSRVRLAEKQAALKVPVVVTSSTMHLISTVDEDVNSP